MKTRCKVIIALVLAVLTVALLSFAAFADNNVKISVSNATAKQGDEVTVNLSIDNNPGLMSCLFSLEYDEERLELIGVNESKAFASGAWKGNIDDIIAGSGMFYWDLGAISVDNTYVGTLAELTFKVLDDAPTGDAVIRPVCGSEGFMNVGLNFLTGTANAGKIHVIPAADSVDIYVDGANGSASNSGATAQTAFKYLNNALNYIKNKNALFTDKEINIFVKNQVRIDSGVTAYLGNDCGLENTINVIGTDPATDIIYIDHTGANILVYNNYKFENVTLDRNEYTTNQTAIFLNGNDFYFGESCVQAIPGKSGNGIDLAGGFFSGDDTQTCNGINITLKTGKWNSVSSCKSKVGSVSGDVILTVGGDAQVYSLFGVVTDYPKDVTANVTNNLIENGFVRGFYGGSSSDMAGYTLKGNITNNIKGGSITYFYGAGTTGIIDGTVTNNITGAATISTGDSLYCAATGKKAIEIKGGVDNYFENFTFDGNVYCSAGVQDSTVTAITRDHVSFYANNCSFKNVILGGNATVVNPNAYVDANVTAVLEDTAISGTLYMSGKDMDVLGNATVTFSKGTNIGGFAFNNGTGKAHGICSSVIDLSEGDITIGSGNLICNSIICGEGKLTVLGGSNYVSAQKVVKVPADKLFVNFVTAPVSGKGDFLILPKSVSENDVILTNAGSYSYASNNTYSYWYVGNRAPQVYMTSLVLDDNISMKYLYEKDIIDGAGKPQAQLSMNGVDYSALEWEENGDYYTLTLPANAAKEIGDKFYVLIDGFNTPDIYSIADNCLNIIATQNDEKYVNLAKAILNYGTAAQDYFNYRPDARIINAYYDGLQKLKYKPINHSDPTGFDVQIIGTSLILKDKISIKYWMVVDSKLSADSLTPVVTIGDEEVTGLTLVQNGDYYTVEIPLLNNKYLMKEVTLTVKNGDTAVSNEYTDSVMAYCAYFESSTAENIAKELNLCEKIGTYVYYTAQYFGEDIEEPDVPVEPSDGKIPEDVTPIIHF